MSYVTVQDVLNGIADAIETHGKYDPQVHDDKELWSQANPNGKTCLFANPVWGQVYDGTPEENDQSYGSMLFVESRKEIRRRIEGQTGGTKYVKFSDYNSEETVLALLRET